MLAKTSRAEMSALARIADSLGTSHDVPEVPLSEVAGWSDAHATSSFSNAFASTGLALDSISSCAVSGSGVF
jgi:hydroxylamine reductase (hybrid-cluster protein)